MKVDQNVIYAHCTYALLWSVLIVTVDGGILRLFTMAMAVAEMVKVIEMILGGKR